MGTEQATGVSDSDNRKESIKIYSREENGGQSKNCGD